jgi:hypothetical protein
MRVIATIVWFVIVSSAAVVGGLLGLFAAGVFLMSLGVHLHDHQDYFSPFYDDAGTPASEFIGAVVFFGAGIVGFLVPLTMGMALWRVLFRPKS